MLFTKAVKEQEGEEKNRDQKRSQVIQNTDDPMGMRIGRIENTCDGKEDQYSGRNHDRDPLRCGSPGGVLGSGAKI